MNIYRRIQNLLNKTVTYKQEDLVINSFIKMAQNNQTRIDSKILQEISKLESTVLQQNIAIEKYKNLIKYLQNNTDASSAINSFMTGNPELNDAISLEKSGNYYDTTVVQPNNNNVGIVTKLPNNSDINTVELNGNSNIIKQGPIVS